jgi:hypothetical protein
VGNVKWETYKLYIKAATYVTWGCSAVVLGKSGLGLSFLQVRPYMLMDYSLHSDRDERGEILAQDLG